MKKLKLIIISLTTVFSIGLTMISPAFALERKEVEKIEFKEALLEVGVKSENVDKLATKLSNGELLDSMNEKYANIAPVESRWISDNEFIERYEYPDGSVKSLKIDGGIFTGKIMDGNYSSGTYWYSWTNARVFATWGVVTASFYADFQGANGAGKIDRVYDYGIITAGGTFSNQSLTINRKDATSSSPALATLFFIGTVTADFGSATFYLRLYVPYRSGAYAQLSVLN